MEVYEIIHIISNPILVIAIYKLFQAFLGTDVYNKKLEIISYILYFIASSLLIYITRVPLISMAFSLVCFLLISFNYCCSINKKIMFSILIYCIMLTIEIVVALFWGFVEINILDQSHFNLSTSR